MAVLNRSLALARAYAWACLSCPVLSGAAPLVANERRPTSYIIGRRWDVRGLPPVPVEESRDNTPESLPHGSGSQRAEVGRTMSRQLQTLITDDLDGSDAAGTVRFGYEGVEYEIDLNEEHLQEFEEFLAPYIEYGRRIRADQRGGGDPEASGNRPGKTSGQYASRRASMATT